MQTLTSLRRATLIGAIAPGFEYGRFLFEERQSLLRAFTLTRWPDEGDRLTGALAVLGAVSVALVFGTFWYLADPLIQFAASAARVLFAPDASRIEWKLATDQALRVMPYAAALGVVTWILYSLSPFKGWPGDVIFGLVGNLIGAWCYGTLLLSWYRLSRSGR